MVICQICGETKSPEKFTYIKNFTRHKKNVIWCHDCQHLFLDMKRQKDHIKKKKLLTLEQTFEVTFL